MKSHGISFVDPAAAQFATDRKRMIERQSIRDAKLSDEVVKVVNAAARARG